MVNDFYWLIREGGRAFYENYKKPEILQKGGS